MTVVGGGFNWSTQHFTLTVGGGVIAMRKKYVRVGFTAAQSSELWDRWQNGEGLKSIGRVSFPETSSERRLAQFVP
jgi:hypothetical protein